MFDTSEDMVPIALVLGYSVNVEDLPKEGALLPAVAQLLKQNHRAELMRSVLRQYYGGGAAGIAKGVTIHQQLPAYMVWGLLQYSNTSVALSRGSLPW